MDAKSVLESLDKADAIRDLLVLAPVVGPGAMISNNLEWATSFGQGTTAFQGANYELAMGIFRDLDLSLPGHERFLTPAKINETFCWLRLGRFSEYIQYYKPAMAGGKPYGLVLWNLAIAFCRSGKMADAELCLRRHVHSVQPHFRGRALLLLSLVATANGKKSEAESSLLAAWETDPYYCRSILVKRLGAETTGVLLGEEPAAKPVAAGQADVAAREEVIAALQEALIPRPPEKHPQLIGQLSEFEYQSGYIAALERFGDGDIEDALRIIDSLIKGAAEKSALLWARTACLLAKREWEQAIAQIEDQLADASLPGGVLWNITCAYFNLSRHPAALATIMKCTDREYRTSAAAWIAEAFLAHLCGDHSVRNEAVREAIKASPKQVIYHVGLLRQLGIDVGGLSSAEGVPILKVEDEQLLTRYQRASEAASVLLSRRPLEAAEQFVPLAPQTIADIPEIEDVSFRPVILVTCPAALYDFKEQFLLAVSAFQKKAYEEGVQRWESLYRSTGNSYPTAINLAASLVITERYSRAVDILLETMRTRGADGGYAMKNLIAAYIRSGKPDQAFPLFAKLLEASPKEYFNFVQMAYVADLLGKREAAASALFHACTVNLAEPSIRLKAAALRACLEVKDYDRAVALVKYFLKAADLPYVVAGLTRPLLLARECRGYFEMSRQYRKFTDRRDRRASLAYFGEVYLARERDYGLSIDRRTVDGLFNACVFYGQSLLWNEDFDRAHETLGQACSILTDHAPQYSPHELSKRYFALSDLYLQRGHYFWSLELCDRGLEADRNNRGLQRLRASVEHQIARIPESSRQAVRDLAEVPLASAARAEEFIQLVPRVAPLIEKLPHDFPACKRVVGQLGDLLNAVTTMDSTPLLDRKKQILQLRDVAGRVEGDLPLYLPKVFISAVLPLIKGVKRALEDIQARSICPEFTFLLEPVNYYRDNEASLVFRLQNTGPADIHKLSIRLDSEAPGSWAPIIEEQTYDRVVKDHLLWIDWPVHLDSAPKPDTLLRPRALMRFTGGSLRGQLVDQAISDQETRLMPFFDISVDYPVVALKPEANAKLYGRESLLRRLKNSFTRSGQTRIPFLSGVRKVGKTSILYFLMARLVGDSLPVYVNLDTSWTNPYELLSKRIADELAGRVASGASLPGLASTRDEFDRFLSLSVPSAGVGNVVLLLDEFHAVIDRIDAGVVPSQFLGDLRYLYMSPQQTVSVILADWYMIDELKRRIPAQLWTDFALEPVSFLNELDAREAILYPAQASGAPVRFEREVVSRIYYWTNGYPWHIQWICSELINHLNTQKRYVAIPQDVDLMAQRLMREDRLFNEGVCRTERLTARSQAVIYSMLGRLGAGGRDACSWFGAEAVGSSDWDADTRREVGRLVQLEVLQEEADQLRFCSPLHAAWFEAKRQKGSDLYAEAATEEGSVGLLSLTAELPQDPAGEVRRLCETLRHLKSQVRQILGDRGQIFKNVEMPEEWANASTPVKTRASWDIFIKALRDLFVEDMVDRLEVWLSSGKHPALIRELNSVRLRRNYAEHRNSAEARNEEEQRCRADVGRRVPTAESEWLLLQLKTLGRLAAALQSTVDQLSRGH
jgi:tetratricopeptide (TPR) repeat protein